MNQRGYREVEHTADWELEVWAPDFPILLEQAARGMYALSGVELLISQRITRNLSLIISDLESALVEFLNELIWYGEDEQLGFDQFQITILEDRLSARLTGAPIDHQMKEIKAVTFHNLRINRTDSGFKVNIVFDV
jgi:SHS2 domain-containing protein